MALARDLRVVTTATYAVAWAATTFVPGAARAEGMSLGIGASSASAPNAEADATGAPPPTSEPPSEEAPAAASPPPTADEGPEPIAIQRPRDKNPAHYEFGFVSVGAYQTWAIAGDVLFFGAGGGLGPNIYRYSKLGENKAGWDVSVEIAYANAFIRLEPIPNLDIDVGPRMGLGGALYNVRDAPQSAFSYGGYVDLRVGSERIKVGPRFEYDRIAYSDYYENGWKLTPLMLRVVH
jgi:hypothetical protein